MRGDVIQLRAVFNYLANPFLKKDPGSDSKQQVLVKVLDFCRRYTQYSFCMKVFTVS